MKNNCEKCAHMIVKATIDGTVKYTECAKLDQMSSEETAKAEYGKGCKFYTEARE